MDYSGTFYVHDDKDDDFAGFVFSFQNNKKFYAFMWKKDKQTYWFETPYKVTGKAGMQLKVKLSYGPVICSFTKNGRLCNEHCLKSSPSIPEELFCHNISLLPKELFCHNINLLPKELFCHNINLLPKVSF